MNKSEILWLNEGYQIFAIEGPNGIKIERLAKRIERNKSAFYYYFATTEIFVIKLTEQHLAKCNDLATKINHTKNIEDLVKVLYSHKTDLLFNRQLRIHRENSLFEKCFIKTNQIVGDSIMPLWSQTIGLNDNSNLSRLVLKLSVENFFLRLTENTISPNWIRDYFNEMKQLIRKLKS